MKQADYLYFDYAATEPVSEQHVKRYAELLTQFYANPVSIHKVGIQLGNRLEQCKKEISTIFKIKPNEIIFTSGASEATNTIFKTFIFQEGEILTTRLEHKSVISPLEFLNEYSKMKLVYLNNLEDGTPDLTDLKAKLNPKVKLVSLMHVNNEIGSITDIQQVRKIIDEYNAKNKTHILLHSDLAQSFLKVPLDLNILDYATLAGHKIGTPKGIGAIYKKTTAPLLPLIHGGKQENSFRGGTSNLPLIVLYKECILDEYEHFDSNIAIVSSLNKYLREKLEKIGVLINTPVHATPYILNVSIPKFLSSIIVNHLSEDHILVSAFAACTKDSQPYSEIVKYITDDPQRYKGSIRISLNYDTTKEDIDTLVTSLSNLIKNHPL
jgi:cysteine desulfurase